MELRRLQNSRNQRQNDEIEPNSELETVLAASLDFDEIPSGLSLRVEDSRVATREESDIAIEEQTEKSNPIATVEEAATERVESENCEIKANRVPDNEDAHAVESPGMAIPGLCAADAM